MSKQQSARARTTKSSKRFLQDIHSHACVSNAESRLEFSAITWIRSNYILNNRKTRSLEEKYCPQLTAAGNGLITIGKIRSRFRSKNNQVTDMLGKYSLDEKRFYLCHEASVYDFDFCSVLNIDQPYSYEWVKTRSSDAHKQKYALRVSYDMMSKCVHYAGSNSTTIGSVSSSCNFDLLAAKEDKIEKNDKYEILCLRASPATLKHLCRLIIRKSCEHNNHRVKSLQKHISDKLVSYLKLPTFLKCSHCLLKGESIVSANGKYKLSLLNDGQLLFYVNEKKDFIFLYEQVDCLNFHEFRLIVNFNNKTSKVFVTDFDDATINFTESKLIVSNEGYLVIQSPYYDFKFLIQFRDDLPSFLNLKKPNFVFNCFYKRVNEDDEEESSENDSESDSDSDDDDDDEDSDLSENSSEDDDDQAEIHAMNKMLIGNNRAKSAFKK